MKEQIMEGGIEAHMTAPLLKSKVNLRDMLRNICEENLKEHMVKLSKCNQSSITANLEQMESMQQLNLSEGIDQADMV